MRHQLRKLKQSYPDRAAWDLEDPTPALTWPVTSKEITVQLESGIMVS